MIYWHWTPSQVLPPERKSINFWLDTGFNTIGKVRERMRNDSGGNISGKWAPHFSSVVVFPKLESSYFTGTDGVYFRWIPVCVTFVFHTNLEFQNALLEMTIAGGIIGY